MGNKLPVFAGIKELRPKECMLVYIAHMVLPPVSFPVPGSDCIQCRAATAGVSGQSLAPEDQDPDPG